MICRGPASLVLPCILALALAAAACTEPAPAEGCASDADCPAGRRCNGAGSCEPDVSTGGSGGSTAADECGASDDCLQQPLDIVPTVYWDGSSAQELCTVPPGRCQGAELCLLPTECREVLDGADRPGSVLCERAEQCESGRCLQQDGIGSCLRSCATTADCPYEPALDGMPELGFGCSEVVDGGVPVHACLPIDPAFPARTLCRTDCDCVPGDGCDAGSTGCRFVGTSAGLLFSAVPVCEPVPPGADRPTGSQCLGDPASCRGGACIAGCQVGGMPEVGPHFCQTSPRRCTQPCELDRDCPARYSCMTGRDAQRVGDWLLPFQIPEDHGRDVRYCQLDRIGCFDELDCCPELDPVLGCVNGWAPDRQRCSVVLSPDSPPRAETRCTVPAPGLATPGQCCAAHAECDSGLCVPARDGTGCAGGGVCSVPCDPDPDPDGVPGNADDRDRCALFDFTPSTYHQASRCLAQDLALPVEGGAELQVRMNVCR